VALRASLLAPRFHRVGLAALSCAAVAARFPFGQAVLTVTADHYDDLIIGGRAGGGTLAS
jgi:hypothetical protein